MTDEDAKGSSQWDKSEARSNENLFGHVLAKAGVPYLWGEEAYLCEYIAKEIGGEAKSDNSSLYIL